MPTGTAAAAAPETPEAPDFSALGLAIGHASDEAGATGCTVVRGIVGPLRAAAVVLGRASGSRELAVASPDHIADRIDAILLTGGSAYGLDAAAGVMRWMEERGRGFPVGPGVVPIVPAAVLFDLLPLGRFDARPTPAMAYAACDAAAATGFAEGSVGAGTGTTVGKGAGVAHAMKGGLGCALASDGEMRVGALAVLNAFGDVRDADGRVLAGARAPGGGFADSARLVAHSSGSAGGRPSAFTEVAMRNTSLAVVASSVALPRVALRQLASAASAALYRRITPTGTSFDGDVVFAVSPVGAAETPVDIATLMRLEGLAVEALEAAIERAVRLARGREGVPGLADAPAGEAPEAALAGGAR